MHAAAATADLEARLAARARPERAAKEAAYLKSDLQHVGVPVPDVRRVVRDLARELGPLANGDLVALAAALWERPVHECRLAAVELLVLCAEQLRPGDVVLLERLLREARTWALVDPLSAKVVGSLCDRYPDDLDPVVRRWATDDDVWIRRSALLAHLEALRVGRGEWQRFCDLADPLLEDREFFVRKALGWVLRDTGRRRPDLVADWLEPRVRRAAGLTVREAVKHLPEDHRDRIRAARARPASADPPTR